MTYIYYISHVQYVYTIEQPCCYTGFYSKEYLGGYIARKEAPITELHTSGG